MSKYDRLEEYNERLRALDDELIELRHEYEDGTIDDEEFDEKWDEIQSKREALEEDYRDLGRFWWSPEEE